ncbi:MAG: tyrosine-type recombinase/integrase [Myxococcota bacterium]
MRKKLKPTKHGSGWRIRWTDAEGARRSETHDKYDDAHFALQRHLVAKGEARRGLRKTGLPSKTFDDICDLWIETRVPGKRSGKKDVEFIRNDLRPAFGGMKLVDIRHQDIERFKVERLDRLSKKSINLLLGLLGSLLRLAQREGWLVQIPEVRKFRLPTNRNDFRFLKTQEEVRRFLDAADQEARLVGMLYRSAVFTGLRAGELAALKVSDVDFERGLITVKRSFDGPTKSDQVRHVPILEPLRGPLDAWTDQLKTGLVFPNQSGRMFEPCSRVFQETLRRVLESAGFPPKHITFHGLRHTFASHWVMAGGDLFKLQKILGHATVQMTMSYSHLVPTAFESDFDRLSRLAG